MKIIGPTLLHKSTSIFMMLALAWLTISIPFVYHEQQKHLMELQQSSGEDITDVHDPFASTTEEKTEENINSISEYLHDLLHHVYTTNELLGHNKCHHADVYVAYHGELLSPPPEFLS